MTAADIGVPDLKLVGPPGLTHYIASMRHYAKRFVKSLRLSCCALWLTLLVREVMSVTPTELSPSRLSADASVKLIPDFEDNGFAVYAIAAEPFPRQSSPSPVPLTSQNRKRERSPDRVDDGLAKRRWTSPVDLPVFKRPSPPPELDRGLPQDMIGEEAQRWREKIVEHMFRPPGVPAPDRLQTPLISEEPEQDTPGSSTAPVISPFRSLRYYHSQLPHATRSTVAFSYICIGPSARGKFDAAKAMDLGLPPGPLRGRLAAGETVVTPDGKSISPDMCIGPSIPPGVGEHVTFWPHLN